MAEKTDSDLAASTAAAWATWRQIRSDEPKSAEAAMAVAAGAEASPEGGAPGESKDIANIVDSVLAELRPKIVAEISKKLGEKK